MNTKPHYDILDGLRGIAALMVLIYHLFEAIAFAAGATEQNMYHGFMGVDFFFILSGFVMGYAYDDRWNKMTVGQFIRRRLIRLHPMVVMGVTIGLIAFCLQGCINWDGSVADTSSIVISTLLALFMLPVLNSSFDVRGNTEMFPLNGPHWSLFFEYIGSLLYALVLHKMSTKKLRIWVVVMAAALFINATASGENTIGLGWSYEPCNMLGGALRLLFAYPAGLLMAREFHNRKIKPIASPFIISAICLSAILLVPNISTLLGVKYIDVVFQWISVTILFPAIIYSAASAKTNGIESRMAKYLGRLSYPLYTIHYPMIYLYIHWINTNQHPFGEWTYATPLGIGLISIVLAVLCLHLYDEPLRKYLNN